MLIDVLDVAIAYSAYLLIVTMQVASQDFTQPTVNALDEFGQRVASALPNVVAALILLGIGYVIGRVVGWAIRKVLEKTNLDNTMDRTSLGQAISRSGWSFSKVISTAAKWFIYVFFIAAAVDVLQFEQLSQAINAIWFWIPNLVAFIVILAVGAVLADFVGSWMQRELKHRGITGGNAIGIAAKGILYAIVLVIAVAQLQIGLQILNTVVTAFVWGIAAAVAIGVGVGLAYGLREFIPSIITGSTHIESTLKQGQKVRFDGHVGTIQQAGAFHIILKDGEGKTLVIPTKNIMGKEIIIESGPSPETPEKRIQRLIEEHEQQQQQSGGAEPEERKPPSYESTSAA